MNEDNFSITHWEEEPVENDSGRKRAWVRLVYRGVITGNATIVYDILYEEEGSARFSGEAILDGEIEGRPGPWRFEHAGSFHDGLFTDEATLVDGPDPSITGVVRSQGRHAQHYAYHFDRGPSQPLNPDIARP